MSLTHNHGQSSFVRTPGCSVPPTHNPLTTQHHPWITLELNGFTGYSAKGRLQGNCLRLHQTEIFGLYHLRSPRLPLRAGCLHLANFSNIMSNFKYSRHLSSCCSKKCRTGKSALPLVLPCAILSCLRMCTMPAAGIRYSQAMEAVMNLPTNSHESEPSCIERIGQVDLTSTLRDSQALCVSQPVQLPLFGFTVLPLSIPLSLLPRIRTRSLSGRQHLSLDRTISHAEDDRPPASYANRLFRAITILHHTP
jgi:hypothetical protein